VDRIHCDSAITFLETIPFPKRSQRLNAVSRYIFIARTFSDGTVSLDSYREKASRDDCDDEVEDVQLPLSSD
jgi:hypothetical protein